MVNKAPRKLNFRARTLDDSFLKDGLVASSLLNGKEPVYLVGGVATQTYLPSSCRRPTSDVDFSVVRPLCYADFKVMVTPISERLRDGGYIVNTVKRSRAYCLDVTNPKTDETLTLEFSRRNEQNFDSNKAHLERELENANTKIIEGTDASCVVASSEDIAIPKTVRSISSLTRNPWLYEFVPKEIEYLSNDRIKNYLSAIGELREEASVNLDPELAEKLRFISDLFDIRLLSELIGFNKKYLAEVASEWNATSKPSEEREALTKTVFPLLYDLFSK